MTTDVHHHQVSTTKPCLIVLMMASVTNATTLTVVDIENSTAIDIWSFIASLTVNFNNPFLSG